MEPESNKSKQGGTPSFKLVAVSAFGDISKKSESRKPAQDSAKKGKQKECIKLDISLPPVRPPAAKIASYACQEASCRSNQPIQSWMKTKFNINAKHGGGTALVLMSRRDKSAKDSAKAEVQLIRCGFDGNNWESTSLMLSAAHTAYHWHEVHTDGDGDLCTAMMFGDGHCCVLSNIATMGHCGCAVVFDAPAVGDGSSVVTSLGTVAEATGGCFLVICSASSVKEGGNVYFLHHRGGSTYNLFVKPLSPDKSDLWQFEGSEGRKIAVKGPSQSHYAVIHDFSEAFTSQHADKPIGKVYHTQAFDGTTPTKILTGCYNKCGRSLVLMCSCSSGTDEATTSALYQVTFQQTGIEVSYLAGSSGTFDNPSVWTISCNEDNLIAVGPSAPCRYAYISNIHEDISNPNDRCDQEGCLATGMATPLDSRIELRDRTLVGWVGRPVPVHIWLNSRVIERLDVDQLLVQPDGRLGFQREFREDEMSPGLKLLRVYCLQQDINHEAVLVELEGSPLRLENQPPGVMFAINLGGPVYEDSNNIVYADTQSLFTFDEVTGDYQCNRYYSGYQTKLYNLYSLMANTHDGFLYTTSISSKVEFDIPLPKGEYGLTACCVGNYLLNKEIIINGKSYSSQVTEAVSEKHHVIPTNATKDTTILFSTEEETTTIDFKTAICAFMIFDPAKYKKPGQTQEERQRDATQTQKMSDQLLPLDRTFLKKEMKIAGWSSNLLKNASGETGDLSGWNIGGEWVVNKHGGDHTETKFVSSYMPCTKYQEIDLTQHFSEAYLDSGPQIQACESFHEGFEHRGFYNLTVTLMNSNGEVVEKKTTGETKITIAQRDWIRESFCFEGYGKGVRLIGFETMARDDKNWKGPFGAHASAAILRVKSEPKAAEDDKNDDVVEETFSKDLLQDLTKILLDINEDYEEQLGDIQETIASKAGNCEPLTETKMAKPVPTKRLRRRKKREIRVFVSSTFVDFKDEREVLIKKVFREVNRLCLDRGVFFSYVDLRWGITNDQSVDGKTIFICLKEVDRCRPYFICLLGDRYGWSQTKQNEDALLDKTYDYATENLEGCEWLDEFRYDTSVTKLEILHAALRKSDVDQSRTFFYVRESRVQRDKLPAPEEKKKGENQWHFDQQRHLREQVVKLGKNVTDFNTAEDAGKKIKEDLIRCVNEDFPLGSQLSHIEKEREAHEAFADVRKRVYIGCEGYFDAIDDHFQRAAEGKNKPLVIMGTSGSGKSALIANWCGRFVEKEPDAFLFMHFIGSSPESASHLNLLRRLYEELYLYLQQDLVVPSTDQNLVLELPTWLKLASNRGNRVMLVFDALNQLDSGAGYSGEEQELRWLPKDLPANVNLLMSTLPGKAKDVVDDIGWPPLQVHPLNYNEKREIINGYMSMYSKTLNEEQLSIITEGNQTNNPLYLKALLDEIRMFGSYEQLTGAIKIYLEAKDPKELFIKILERLESDFESGAEARCGLVRDTTVAIWCCHRGMSEQELLNFLQVPSNIWSPFYLSLEENLVNRNGILNFFHDYMRQAVEKKYLSTEEKKRAGYVSMANFFSGEDIDDRYVDELPYLLAQAGKMNRLRAIVLNIAVFQRLMNTEEGKFQLIKSWQLLGGYDQVEEAYIGVLDRSDWNTVGNKTSLMRSMAGFFMQLGLLKGAKLLLDSLLKQLEEQHIDSHGVIVYHHGKNSFKRRCNYPDVIDVLIEIGTVCRKLDMLADAVNNFHDALSRQQKPNKPAEKLRLVKTLMGLGSIEKLRGNAKLAKQFLTRSREVATQVLGFNHHYVASIIGQIGELSYSQGVLEGAILHHLIDLKLTQTEVGLNHPRTAAVLNNIALVLDDLNNSHAGTIFQAVLAILVEAYGKDYVDVAIVRYNLGTFFLATNYFQKASFQYQEALRIFTEFLGDEHPHTKSTATAIEKLRAIVE